MNILVVDTGPLLANIDAADQHHEKCAELFKNVDRQLVVPAPVLVEVEYWCRKRLPIAAWNAFLEDIRDGLLVIRDQTLEEVLRAGELCSKYRNINLGYVDASVVATCEALCVQDLATIDGDFLIVQPSHCSHFRVVPEI